MHTPYVQVSTCGLPYPKLYATFLPLAAPALLVAVSDGAPAFLGARALAYGAVCSLLGVVLMKGAYPRSGKPTPLLQGGHEDGKQIPGTWQTDSRYLADRFLVPGRQMHAM
jgi:hypothetical protein